MSKFLPIPPQEIALLRDLAQAGLNAPRISAQTGWSETSVRRYAGDVLPPRSQPITAEKREAIRAYAVGGHGALDIAAWTGVSADTVRRHAGDLLEDQRSGPDVERLRRMIAAVAEVPHGARDAVANRFGLADANSLKATISTMRRRLRDRGLLPSDLETSGRDMPSTKRVDDLYPSVKAPLGTQIDELRETVRRYQDALVPSALLPVAWNLTPMQERLLRAIRACGPDVCLRERACLALYGCSDDAPAPRVIDVVLSKVRRRLAAAGAGIAIENVWSVGWRMPAESCARFDAAVAADRAQWPDHPAQRVPLSQKDAA